MEMSLLGESLSKRGWQRKEWHRLQRQPQIQRRIYRQRPSRLPVKRNNKEKLKNQIKVLFVPTRRSFRPSSRKAKVKAFLLPRMKIYWLVFLCHRRKFAFPQEGSKLQIYYEKLLLNTPTPFARRDNRQSQPSKKSFFLAHTRVATLSQAQRLRGKLYGSRKLDAK